MKAKFIYEAFEKRDKESKIRDLLFPVNLSEVVDFNSYYEDGELNLDIEFRDGHKETLFYDGMKNSDDGEDYGIADFENYYIKVEAEVIYVDGRFGIEYEVVKIKSIKRI